MHGSKQKFLNICIYVVVKKLLVSPVLSSVVFKLYEFPRICSFSSMEGHLRNTLTDAKGLLYFLYNIICSEIDLLLT
jgi:hypothetical protein